MATEESRNDIHRLVEIAWRRKWVILVPFLAIFASVTLWGLYLPNLYRSTASILIEPQKVPTEYVTSTVTSDLETRLRTVTQQMSSRTKLMKVIKELESLGWKVGDSLLYQPEYQLTEEQQHQYAYDGKPRKSIRPDIVLIDPISHEVLSVFENKLKDEGLSRWHILRGVEASLKRLNTDCLDICYLHAPDYETPLEESLAAADQLVRQGALSIAYENELVRVHRVE